MKQQYFQALALVLAASISCVSAAINKANCLPEDNQAARLLHFVNTGLGSATPPLKAVCVQVNRLGQIGKIEVVTCRPKSNVQPLVQRLKHLNLGPSTTAYKQRRIRFVFLDGGATRLAERH